MNEKASHHKKKYLSTSLKRYSADDHEHFNKKYMNQK